MVPRRATSTRQKVDGGHLGREEGTESQGSLGTVSAREDAKSSGDGWWDGLHNVNIPNATTLYTQQWAKWYVLRNNGLYHIIRHVMYTSCCVDPIIVIQKYTGREPEQNSLK